MAKYKKIFLIVLIVCFTFFTYAFFEAFWLKISSQILENKDIPANFKGKKIVFASDFHCGFFWGREKTAAVVSGINDRDADIVILGGDYVDYDWRYIAPCFDELKKIKSKYGVFGILGNHDYIVGSELIKEAMQKASIFVLDNKGQWIDFEGDRIKIGGVADFLKSRANPELILKDVKKEDFVVLAVHNPTYVEKIRNQEIDLVLSGHTHGGQVNFFGLWSPFFEIKYGHRYRTGLHEIDSTTLIVSNGVGTTLVPLRFFSRPQINVITLQKPK